MRNKLTLALVFIAALLLPSGARAACAASGGIPFSCERGTTPQPNDLLMAGQAATGKSVQFSWAQLFGAPPGPLAMGGLLLSGSNVDITGGAIDGVTFTPTFGSAPVTVNDAASYMINVKSYGAKEDGTTDDSAAWIAAINKANALAAAGTPVCIYVPAGLSRIVSALPMFLRAGCILGDGPHRSYVIVDKTYSGDVFSWSEGWYDGDLFPPFAPRNDMAGPRVQGISVIGDLTTANPQNAFMFYDRNDDVLMRDVEASYIAGSCLGIGFQKNQPISYMRESKFYNVRFHYCGTPTTPAMEITSTGGGDSTNNLVFFGLDIFGYYQGLVIRNKVTDKDLGILRFFSLRVERDSTVGGAKDLLQIGDTDAAYVRPVSNINIYGLVINDPIAGYSALAFYANSAAQQPYNIIVEGLIGPGPGKGVNVQSGRFLRFRLNGIATTDTNFVMGPAGLVGDRIELDTNREPVTTAIDTTAEGFFKLPAYRSGIPPTSPAKGAVDWQFYDATSIGGTGSGQFSTISGGLNGFAEGQFSGNTNGSNSHADGDYSRVGGLRADPRVRYGADCYASGFIAALGDAQTCTNVLRGTSTSVTPVQLTADALAAGAHNCINIVAGFVYALSIQVVATNHTTPGNAQSWTVRGLLQRPTSPGSTTFTAGTPEIQSTGAVGTVSATADTTNGCLSIVHTAPNTDLWDVVARVTTAETF